MIGAYVLFWLALVIIAVANGVVRELIYGRALTELRAHQLSTLIGMLLIGTAVGVFGYFFPIESEHTAMLIGLIWLGLTVLFELVFGRFIARHSWKKLLADYDLLAGRVWLVFLAWLLILPYIVYRAGAG